MPSVGPLSAGLKNTAGGYFIPLGDCTRKVLAYSGGSGAGGSYLSGSFTSTLTWMGPTATTPQGATSTLASAGAGGLLRDAGKTVVSSGRVFRKVQFLVSTGTNTNGIGGSTDYLTGYIELMSGAGGPQASVNPGMGQNAAPVAYYPASF